MQRLYWRLFEQKLFGRTVKTKFCSFSHLFIYSQFAIEATSNVDVVGSEDIEERNIKKKKFKKRFREWLAGILRHSAILGWEAEYF